METSLPGLSRLGVQEEPLPILRSKDAYYYVRRPSPMGPSSRLVWAFNSSFVHQGWLSHMFRFSCLPIHSAAPSFQSNFPFLPYTCISSPTLQPHLPTSANTCCRSSPTASSGNSDNIRHALLFAAIAVSSVVDLD